MSLGNGNPKDGDKGSNFNYELKVLQGLEAIAVVLEAGIKNPQFIRVTDGTAVTGVTSATKSVSVLIPANTIEVGDTVFIRTRCRKTGTAAIAVQSIYINTSDAIGGFTTALNLLGNTSLYGQMSRTLAIKSATVTETLNVNTGGVDDDATSTNAVSNFNINWAADQYIVFGFTNSSAADSTVTSYYEITVNKG
jgi:hypothetical protein